jgi:serine/threonine protein kinase/lipoprotein NlpI
MAQRDAAGRDELLDAVVVAYLEELEKGHAPEVQKWLARYPELANELADFLVDQHKVHRWTGLLREAARSVAEPIMDLTPTVDERMLEATPSHRVRLLGDYMLLAEIARGGMGIVYRARQMSLDRLVAVKMILAGQLASMADVQRFQTEAVAAARLEHPHIVPIYEVGEHDGQHFYSMKLMEGGNLADQLTELNERPRAAAALVSKIAQAVHHAHQHGILHRDLKPGNVLLDSAGEPHVSDFGLAKHLSDLHQSSVVVGTPSYMAPEQASGQQGLTTASDVYSLGAILYAMLTGRPPFRAENRQATLHQLAEQTPARPRTLNARVDRELETICLKCLDKSPAQRYHSAQALANDLERYLADEPIEARPTSLWARGLKWARRRPAVAALLAVSVAAILSLGTSYLQYQDQRASAAEHALQERHRTDELQKEVRRLLRLGEQALAQHKWADAKAYLASARQLLGAEKALLDLQAPVELALAASDVALRRAEARQEADQRLRSFMQLREEALLQGTLATGALLPDSTDTIRATAQAALSCFAVSVAPATGPIFAEPFTHEERQTVQEGCYELLLMLAESEAQARPGRLEQAIRLLDRAAALGHETRAYHLRRARYLQQLGDSPGARQASDRAAALPPTGALDYFMLGEDLQRQGQLQAAISMFQQAQRLQPDHFWTRYFLAVCYLRLQPARADLARENLTACLRPGPQTLWVYLLRGIAHSELELFQAAEEDFQKALDCQPHDEARYALYLNRGVVFRRQGKTTQAIVDLQQAIALKPRQYQAYANLAKVYRQQKQFAAALGQLDRALQAATECVGRGLLEKRSLALLYRDRAMLQLDRQDPAAALEDFRRVLDLDPRATDHAECGRILYGLERYQEGLQSYEAALALDAGYAAAHLGRAETLYKLDNYREAVGALDQYLRQPNLDAASAMLADVYRARGLTQVKLGHYAEAISDFTLTLNRKADAVTFAYRGWAYLVTRTPQLALPDFEKALQLDPHFGDAFNGRGAARMKLGTKPSDYRAAVADAAQAVRCGPTKDARLWWNAAHIYAEAASRLEAERQDQAYTLSAEYRAQAVQLLRSALAVTPAAERASFWRKYIQADPDLARFGGVLRSP